jgi:cytochrome c oxidase subunit 2
MQPTDTMTILSPGRLADLPMGLLGQTSPSWWDRLWFREAASSFAPSSDAIYYFIFGVSALFFVLLIALMLIWGINYRRSQVGEVAAVSSSHNTALELSWSITPAILFAIMFFWGFHAYMTKLIAPVDSLEVYVTARQWGWGFTYPDGLGTTQNADGEWETIDGRRQRELGLAGGKAAPIIAVPQGKPVKMIMTSQDVIHSFYVPAFRVKRDIFPNRYTTLWFEATSQPTHTWNEDDRAFQQIQGQPPGFYLFCAEYCGDQHSQMNARVYVLNDADYQKWRAAEADTSGVPLLELGKTLYTAEGCSSCHSVDGSPGTGPSWLGIWGSRDHIPGWQPPAGSDAEPGVVGEDYIRQSILEPDAYYTPGYPPQMVSYQGQLSERELLALTLYIKSLSEDPADVAEAEAQSQAEIAGEEAELGGDALEGPDADVGDAGGGDPATAEDRPMEEGAM